MEWVLPTLNRIHNHSTLFSSTANTLKKITSPYIITNNSAVSCASVKRVIVRNHSYENMFCLQVHFHASQSHLHKNGFALSYLSVMNDIKTPLRLVSLVIWITNFEKSNSIHCQNVDVIEPFRQPFTNLSSYL